MTPSQRYAEGAKRGEWRDDPAQHPALRELDRIQQELLSVPESRSLGFWRKKKPVAVKGLYYWGEVGRGKTFLVDLFYDGLPVEKKFRTHFHRFMRSINDRLREHAGQTDPLLQIAREWRENLRVLVLDEFFVTDIGDAMLLSRLLDRLFAEGVTLITTSNTAPENLYKDGLQRSSFLPAIALLQDNCVVLRSDGREDYRMRALTRSPVYRSPLDAPSGVWLSRRWAELSNNAPEQAGEIEIDGRQIPFHARSHDIVWFGYDVLCEGPRGTTDYIEIAREFSTVLMNGIPVFDEQRENPARRFVNLIDELYDRQVNLVCTAAAPPPDLYTGHRLQGAFERTASRLIEMQSEEYLVREHLA